MIDSSRLWTSLQDDERETPVGSGICRAMTQAFPLIVVDDALPERMKAAIQALADCEILTSEGQLPDNVR